MSAAVSRRPSPPLAMGRARHHELIRGGSKKRHRHSLQGECVKKKRQMAIFTDYKVVAAEDVPPVTPDGKTEVVAGIFEPRDMDEKLLQRMEDLEVRMGGLQSGYNDLKAENEDIKAENEDIKADYKEIKAENKDLKAENEDIKADYKEIKADYKEIKAEKKEIKDENKEIKAENKEIKAQYKKSEKANTKLRIKVAYHSLLLSASVAIQLRFLGDYVYDVCQKAMGGPEELESLLYDLKENGREESLKLQHTFEQPSKTDVRLTGDLAVHLKKVKRGSHRLSRDYAHVSSLGTLAQVLDDPDTLAVVKPHMLKSYTVVFEEFFGPVAEILERDDKGTADLFPVPSCKDEYYRNNHSS